MNEDKMHHIYSIISSYKNDKSSLQNNGNFNILSLFKIKEIFILYLTLTNLSGTATVS